MYISALSSMNLTTTICLSPPGVIKYCSNMQFASSLQIAIALSVGNAAEKTTTIATAETKAMAEVAKTKEPRGKRNLNHFGNYDVSRRADGYDFQPSGYSKLMKLLLRLKLLTLRFFLFNRLRAEQLYWRWISTW